MSDKIPNEMEKITSKFSVSGRIANGCFVLAGLRKCRLYKSKANKNISIFTNQFNFGCSVGKDLH